MWSLEFTSSQPPSVPHFLSLETEPLFLDNPLAERLHVLEMIHYRALEFSTLPNCAPATLSLLRLTNLPSFCLWGDSRPLLI